MKKLKKMSNAMIDLQSEIYDENQDKLTKIANQSADINAAAVTKTAKAIKQGFKDTKLCEQCNNEIDVDSKFCKMCGKKL